MKRNILILLALVFGYFTGISQNISAGFNSTHSGRSVSATYSIEKENYEIGFGLGININQKKHNDDQNNLFLKRLYADNFAQYFAFKGFYHRNINFQIENVKPYFFYDLQIRYSKTRNRFTSSYPFGFDSTLISNRPNFDEPVNSYGPFTWVEQTVGLGIDIQINERFFLRQKFGIGVNSILGTDNRVKFSWYLGEFGALYNIEIGYKLQK